MPGLRRNLSNASAHDTGADDKKCCVVQVNGHGIRGVWFREIQAWVDRGGALDDSALYDAEGTFHFGGRLFRKASKPSRASSVPRTRAIVWALSSRTSGVIGATASCAR